MTNYPENYLHGNRSYGKIIKPIGVILHHNNLPKGELIRQCTERKAFINAKGLRVPPASYHCVGWKDGSRTTFVDDNLRAWHAGKSEYKGLSGLNDYMMGYCFHGNTNQEPLTTKQIHTFIEWLIPRIEKHSLTIEWIISHMMAAPGRKVDISESEYKTVMQAIKYLWL